MISIVIVTLNRPLEVRRAVESCLNWLQTKREFILIDNSEDSNLRETAEQLQRIYCEENFYYEAEERNLGVSGGRNRGWLLAKGEYVLFLDDDAIIHSMKCSIEQILSEFTYNPKLAILALEVYVPAYDLYMKPRT